MVENTDEGDIPCPPLPFRPINSKPESGMPGTMEVSEIPPLIQGDTPTGRPARSSTTGNQHQGPILRLSATLVPNEEEIANQVREFEQVYEALENQERNLEVAISEARRDRPLETISAIAVKTLNESDGPPPSRPCRKRREFILLSVFFSGVVVVLVVTVLEILNRRNKNGDHDSINNNDSSSQSTPQTIFPSVSPTISPEVTNLTNLLTKQYPGRLDTDEELGLLFADGTAQHQALYWLALEDDWTREALNQEIPIELIGERYALTILYFAGEGEQWEGEVNWLRATTSVCNWTATGMGDFGQTLGEGISCDEDDFVISLDLCKYCS